MILDELIILKTIFKKGIFSDAKFEKFETFYTDMLSDFLEELVKNISLVNFITVFFYFDNFFHTSYKI